MHRCRNNTGIGIQADYRSISDIGAGSPAISPASLISRSERAEDREQLEGLEDLLLRVLDPRSIDDDDVARIDRRILHLAMLNAEQIESRRLALPIDGAENRDSMHVCRLLVGAAGKGDSLHQGHFAQDREGAGPLNGPIHRHNMPGGGLHPDGNVRVFEIFLAVFLGEQAIELSWCQAYRGNIWIDGISGVPKLLTL